MEVQVELTEDEKKCWFRKKEVPDLASKEMSSTYEKFSLPSKEEGCDELLYMWYKAPQCQQYLEKWVLDRKLVQRVEDLQPSDWFRGKHAEWNRVLGFWTKRKQQEYKEQFQRECGPQSQKAGRKEAKKKAKEEGAANEKEDKEEEKEKAEEEGKEKDEEKEKEKEADEKEEMEVDAESLDPFAVEDVCDIGGSQPLFANFGYEDWVLIALRFELHLLCHAFRHDLDDPDRTSFQESHLAFYYQKYFKRPLNLRSFGVDSNNQLVELVKDVVELNAKGALEAQLSSDSPLENFVRLTEDARRDRQLRVDAGDARNALSAHYQLMGNEVQ
ncbi:unnamed protein product [Effrenium voratum]|nr:unnamed protein product [Effrenium voratum]